MKTPVTRLGAMASLLVVSGWIALSGTSSATLEIQKQAKAAGVDAKNCQFCHVAALPKKDSHENNDRGKWLIAEKEKRNAKAVDGAWAKDYPGTTK